MRARLFDEATGAREQGDAAHASVDFPFLGFGGQQYRRHARLGYRAGPADDLRFLAPFFLSLAPHGLAERVLQPCPLAQVGGAHNQP